MLKNFIKIAWRNIINNKIYSSLNILGLAAGMAGGFADSLMGYIISTRLINSFPIISSYMRYGEILTAMAISLNFNTTSLKLAGALRNIPEIEDVIVCDGSGPHGLMVGDKKLFPVGVQITSNFLKLFR